jgi:ring-1,2-phenylacetyl-CoA epoxidase subunit PaaB
MEEILDPRLRRLDLQSGTLPAKEKLDQLPTFEVFIQTKEPRPYKHEGCVHATSLSMALIFAKEQFSRRGTCSGIWVVSTKDIYVTDYSENEIDIYDKVDEDANCAGEAYSIFHMIKRGSQHSFAGEVNANSAEGALACAKTAIERKKPVLNAWVTKSEHILKTASDDQIMWQTTPQKLFREAIDYKTQEKLNKFKSEQS